MKNWTMFLIAIGFLFMAVSPQLPSSLLYLVIGLVMVIVGFVKVWSSKKK